jgi:PhnB protein
MPVNPIPSGYHTVCPYLTVDDATAQLEFLKAAFDARVVDVMKAADGRIMHGDVIIGDSHVMLGQATAEWPARPTYVHLYVRDCDAVYRAAVAAGAKSVREPQTQFYGDRSGGVEDVCGNQWWISTHVEDVPAEEMERRAKEWSKQKAQC